MIYRCDMKEQRLLYQQGNKWLYASLETIIKIPLDLLTLFVAPPLAILFKKDCVCTVVVQGRAQRIKRRAQRRRWRRKAEEEEKEEEEGGEEEEVVHGSAEEPQPQEDKEDAAEEEGGLRKSPAKLIFFPR